MSGDIELRNFVPLEQIPPLYFQKPYFLAPSGKSAKAYHLLAATMERTGRVGIGSFVMRGHDTWWRSSRTMACCVPTRCATPMRFARRRRWLAEASKAAARKVNQFAKDIDELTRKELDLSRTGR